MQRGFTILELIISLGIIAALAAASTIYLAQYQRSVTLDAAAKDIVSRLRLAQGRSVAGEDGDRDGRRDKWGIRFSNNAQDSYMVFYGAAYSTASTTETVTLPSGIVFTDPAESTNEDIIFTAITGTTTAASITIARSDNDAESKTISIDGTGKINTN